LEPPSSVTVELIVLSCSILGLITCSALISGSEAAFFSLTPGQKDALKEEGDPKGERVLWLLSNPDYLLGTILQANNVVNILIVLLSTMLMGSLFDFSSYPVIEFLVNTIFVTFFLLMFGEVLPKVIATHYPVQFAKMMAMPISALMPVTKPFNALMTKFTNRLSERFDARGEVTLEELSEAVDIATPTSSDEKKILKGIVKLPTISVEKIMKPRVDVVAIDIDSTNEEVIRIANECGFSRLPVYQEDLDDIKGFLYIKDMLPYLVDKSGEFNWKDHIREAYYVPESKKINDLLEEFRQKKMHLAVVVDEYGGTDGIVTLEDILEEIVGEIVDESDFEELDELNRK
jgi:gliding motility-associated protein GldE